MQNRQRQGDGECRSLPGSSAVDANRSAMKFNQLFYDGKAQPKAAMAAGGGSIGLTKPVENERKKLWLDTLAGVNHANFQMGVHSFQHHLDAAAFRGELHRIREQVPQYLLQTVYIAADGDAV